jgi:hypothetical protein
MLQLVWYENMKSIHLPCIHVDFMYVLLSVGIRCADHANTLYSQKLALSSLISGGRSVGRVRLRTKATEFSSATSRA